MLALGGVREGGLGVYYMYLELEYCSGSGGAPFVRVWGNLPYLSLLTKCTLRRVWYHEFNPLLSFSLLKNIFPATESHSLIPKTTLAVGERGL